MKQEAPERVVAAIENILAGRLHVSERIMVQVLGLLKQQSERGAVSPIDRLTDRELQILQLIGKGLTTREIADRINLSIKTIGTYRERIKEKIGLRSAAELIRYAVLLDAPP